MRGGGEMRKTIQPEPLEPAMPEEIELVNVDPLSGLRYDEDCEAGVLLPFIRDSAPTEGSPCGGGSAQAAPARAAAEADAKAAVKQEPEKRNWLQRLFN